MAKGRKTGGRRAGVPNKVTADVRAAVGELVRRNFSKVESWLLEIEDPAKRVGLFLDLCEYHIPKLGRVEHTGKDGEALTVQIVRYGNDPPAQ